MFFSSGLYIQNLLFFPLVFQNIHFASSQLQNLFAKTVCPLLPTLNIIPPFGDPMPRTCISTTTGERCYYTYIPECAGKKSPLVYDIHAFTSCPGFQQFYSDWRDLAKDECMVIVWPMGNFRREIVDDSCWHPPYDIVIPASIANLTTDIAPCCCEKDGESINPEDVDDLSFLRDIASHIVQTIPEKTNDLVTIDTKRIYMAGHSNGCITSFAMAMKHSDMVAAVCCHAGALLTQPSFDYDPTPIWFAHATSDTTLPYNGTSNWVDTNETLLSQQIAFDFLSDINGCDRIDTTFLTEEVGFVQSASNCTDGANVEFMTLYGSEHTPYKGCDTEFDTTQAAWNFCSSYELDEEPLFEVI